MGALEVLTIFLTKSVKASEIIYELEVFVEDLRKATFRLILYILFLSTQDADENDIL